MSDFKGYVKLFRKFKRWGWYQDSLVKAVFIHCLLSASYRDFEWMGKKYRSGQFITSVENLSIELNISVKQVRNALDKLTKSNEILRQTTNKFTVITVKRWEHYQFKDYDDEAPRAIKRQMRGNQKANEGQQYKNIKNIKNNSVSSNSAWPNVQNLTDLCKKELL